MTQPSRRWCSFTAAWPHAHWWSFIAPQLTHHYFVTALDLSGHGDSGRRTAYSAEQWANEVMAVFDDSGGLGRPIIVGHSMGGIVAIVYGGPVR